MLNKLTFVAMYDEKNENEAPNMIFDYNLFLLSLWSQIAQHESQT